MVSDHLKVTIEKFDPIIVGLVQLFGKNPVSQINSSLISSALNIEWEREKLRYKDDCLAIAKLKKRIEIIKETKRSARIGLFLRSLDIISDYHLQDLEKLGPMTAEISSSRHKELELMHDLILYSDGHKWSQRQLEYFDLIYNVIRDWNQCFISFTRRGSERINQRYKKVIKRYGEKNIQFVIAKFLNSNWGFRRVFLDENKFLTGETVEDVTRHCKTSMVVLQLVQLNSFNQPGKNWKFIEFNAFLHSHEELRRQFEKIPGHRIKPLILEDKSLPIENRFEEFNVWHTYVMDKKLHKYLPTQVRKFEKVMHEIGKEIKLIVNELISGAPLE